MDPRRQGRPGPRPTDGVSRLWAALRSEPGDAWLFLVRQDDIHIHACLRVRDDPRGFAVTKCNIMVRSIKGSKRRRGRRPPPGPAESWSHAEPGSAPSCPACVEAVLAVEAWYDFIRADMDELCQSALRTHRTQD